MSTRKTSSSSKSSFEAEELLDLRARVAQLTAQVQTLMDHAAIRDVLRRYARGLDRHDVELETSALLAGCTSELRPCIPANVMPFVKWGNEGHEKGYLPPRAPHHQPDQSTSTAIPRTSKATSSTCCTRSMRKRRKLAALATSTAWNDGTANGESSCVSSCRTFTSACCPSFTPAFVKQACPCRAVRALGTRPIFRTCGRCRERPQPET